MQNNPVSFAEGSIQWIKIKVDPSNPKAEIDTHKNITEEFKRKAEGCDLALYK